MKQVRKKIKCPEGDRRLNRLVIDGLTKKASLSTELMEVRELAKWLFGEKALQPEEQHMQMS